MKQSILALCLMMNVWHLQAQFEIFYHPITFSGEVPDYFRESVREKSLSEIQGRDRDQLSKKESKEYYTISNYALSQVYLSGNVYFNDILTDYVNRVVDHLLEDDPAFRSQLKVHVTRFPTPNATSWRDGTIFINIGLLGYLENEAQLAYILAHEITHYKSKHSLLSYQKKQDLKQNYFGKNEDTDRLFAQLKYSREQELEADSKGLELYLKSAYDPAEASKALLMLQVSNDDEEGETKRFPLDLAHIFAVDSSRLCGLEKDYTSYQEDEGESETIVGELTEEEKEQLRTHPSIEARIKALERLLPKQEDPVKKKFIEPKADFFQAKQVSFFELVEKYYQQFRYGRSLYLSLLMLERWPDNLYLHTMSCKNMYWIAYFRHQGTLDKVVEPADRYEDSPFQDYLCFLNRLTKKQMNRVARDYLEKKKERFGSQEDIDILLAKQVELYETKKDAEPFYEQYLKDYPDGKYQYFVERKLNQRK